MSRERRGKAPFGPPIPPDPRRPGAPAPRPSPERDAHLAARAAGEDRERVVGRLVCRERGCREVLGYVEVGASRAGGPEVRIAIRAPMSPRLPQTGEGDVWKRAVLTGSQDPRLWPSRIVLDAWPRGSRIEFVCKAGHESRFGAGQVAAVLRRA